MTSRSLLIGSPVNRGEALLVQRLAGGLWFLGFVAPPAPGPNPGFSTGLFAALGWIVWLAAVGHGRVSTWSRAKAAALSLGGVGFAILILAAARTGHVLDVGLLSLACLVFVKANLEPDMNWGAVLAKAVVCAALVNAVIAMVQALFPSTLEGLSPWVASNMATPGRAGGNLGQPNQLAMLAVLALLMLLGRPDWGVKQNGFLAVVLGGVLAWTGSRTGLLCLAGVTAWALMTRGTRGLVSVRVATIAAWVGVLFGGGLQWFAAKQGSTVFFASLRAHGGSDVSSSRVNIWIDSWGLFGDQPLSGVGWGEFNYAWTLSDSIGRGHALLGHAHNLILQWVVELGFPLTLVLVTVLAILFWLAIRRIISAPVDARLQRSVILVALGVLLLHSQLEYPLWYAYFLLPAVFWLGLLSSPVEESGSDSAKGGGVAVALNGLRWVGGLALLIGVYAVFDYSRVVQVYEPFGSAKYQPLDSRIERARSGVFFGHFGDLAWVFTHDPSTLSEDDFRRPMHYLINPALLKVYAEYLDARGKADEANRMVRILKEYHSPVVDAFFAVCSRGDTVLGKPPFQCRP